MTDTAVETPIDEIEATKRGIIARLLLPVGEIAKVNNYALDHAHEVYSETASLLRVAVNINCSPDRAAVLADLKERAAVQSGWTDDRMLLALYQIAFVDSSRSQVAKVLGKATRNSVIGRLRRIGITAQNSKHANQPARIKAKRLRIRAEGTAGETPEEKAAKQRVIDKDATTDDMIMANRALTHRAGGTRLLGISRFAALHEPFTRVNSGFAPAGPIHRAENDVYAVAAHESLPMLAVWRGDTAHIDEAGWTIYAQTITAPTVEEHSGNTINMRARRIGQNTDGQDVYLITGKTLPLMDDDGKTIPDSDMPDAAAFESGLKSLGLGGNDDLLPVWSVTPTAVGPKGVTFRSYTDVDEIPVAMAIESEPVALRIKAPRAYTSQKLAAIVAAMRQPNSTMKSAAMSYYSSLAGPMRGNSYTGPAALDKLIQ